MYMYIVGHQSDRDNRLARSTDLQVHRPRLVRINGQYQNVAIRDERQCHLASCDQETITLFRFYLVAFVMRCLMNINSMK